MMKKLRGRRRTKQRIPLFIVESHNDYSSQNKEDQRKQKEIFNADNADNDLDNNDDDDIVNANDDGKMQWIFFPFSFSLLS